MAGAEFDAGDFPQINPEDITPEKILANMPTSQGDTNGRKILDRFIRDFEKSTSKKSLSLNSRVQTLAARGAPRTDDPQELDSFVDTIQEQQRAIVETSRLQLEKEYDNIKTRLETTKLSSDADFEQIKDFKDSVTEQIDRIVSTSLQEATEQIRNRGRAAIARREDNRLMSSAAETAQEAGEAAFRDYLDANRGEVSPTIGEFVSSAFGDLFNVRGRTDGRIQRRDAIIAQANEEARRASSEAYDATGRSQEDDGFEYKQRPAGEGFRLRDMPSMAGILRRSMPLLAITAIDKAIKSSIGAVGDAAGAAGNPNTSTSDLLDKLSLGAGAFGSNIPLNVGGQVLDKLISVTEEIANNTAAELAPFSGEIMSANLDKQMRLIEANFGRAEEVGTTLAGIINSRTDLEMAMRAVGDTIIKEFGPTLIGIQEVLTVILGAINQLPSITPEWVKGMLTTPNGTMGSIGMFIKLLWEIGEAKLKKLRDQKFNVLDDIDNFFQNRPTVVPGMGNNPNIPLGI